MSSANILVKDVSETDGRSFKNNFKKAIDLNLIPVELQLREINGYVNNYIVRSTVTDYDLPIR